MRHTEQEGAGGREEEVMLAVELATKAYRKINYMYCKQSLRGQS